MPTRIIDRLILGALRIVPTRLAHHAMFLLQSNPHVPDRWGYHIRPIHYYEPLPDFRNLTEEKLSRRRMSSVVDFRIEHQKELAGRLGQKYGEELRQLATTKEPAGFDFGNAWFNDLDASMYYSLIRELRPKRVMEIGSGYSTRIADKALSKNRSEGSLGQLICIEPYPQPRLTDAGLQIQLVQKQVEEMSLDFFSQLESGDVLFIDSSHVATFGGDVCREFLEILPSLKPGVWIHVHDIFFPYDYPKNWMVDLRYAFNEQYLLEAFLAYNASFSVQIANHWLWREYPELVMPLNPRKNNHASNPGISSFWMRKELDA